MNIMNTQQVEPEPYTLQGNQTEIGELAKRIASIVSQDGSAEPLKGVFLHRASAPRRLHSVSKPAFCVIAQGSKEIFLADERYHYDPAHYLLVTSELPIVSHTVDASTERPYLSFRLEFDPILVSSVMVEAGHPAKENYAEMRAMNVSVLDANLLDAVLRLVRLIDNPAEASFLAPLITREIIYRLLKGEQGNRLRQIAVLGGQSHRIAKAIERIRKEFDQALKIETIARDLGMSVSGFHHHFKSVTAMSPLQFQKRLRLQEARRLMLGENLDAASAAYRVGYDDASHFNREYKRLFGFPPMRDVERLREAAKESVEPTLVYAEDYKILPESRYAATD
jgi:AraC-like DNA-binding protein